MQKAHLKDAVTAINQGDKDKARMVLRTILLQNPRNEQAWMLLAGLVEKREQVDDCLEQVLRINPQNETAQRALSAQTTDKFEAIKSSGMLTKSGRAALEGDSIKAPQKEKKLLPRFGNRLFASRSESPKK